MALSVSVVLLCVAVVHQSCQQSINTSTSQQLTMVPMTILSELIIMTTSETPNVTTVSPSDFVTPNVTALSSSTTPSSMTLGPVLTQTRVRTEPTVLTQTKVRTESTVLTQTKVLMASLSTLLPTTSSMSTTDLPSLLSPGHLPSSSGSPSPSSELPTESTPRNGIEFVRKYPIATSMVGATALFLTCTLGCLCCAIFYRKRRLSRKRRRPTAPDNTGDVFINPLALQEPPPNRTLEESTALPNISPLQGVLNEALIVSNPQAETSFAPPQYHELLSAATTPHPSAPPRHLYIQPTYK